jgi:adenylate cyclase
LVRFFTATSAARTASIFTVVGPAFYEVSRILGDERSVEQNVLVSASFVDGPDARMRRGLVSVGRYAVRGVAHPQEVLTPEPGFAAPRLRL